MEMGRFYSPLPPLLFMGLVSVLKDVKKDASDGGRRLSGRAGPVRHSYALWLVDFIATGASQLHHPQTPPKSVFPA